MSPLDALLGLLARVGALQGEEVLVSEEELMGWPAEATWAMQSQGLLTKAAPAASAVCPGCEEQCTMPVHSPPTRIGRAAAFIVCDKRDDINRVTVPMESLRRWRCDAESTGSFIAQSLAIRPPDEQRRTPGGLWEIGIATGSKRRQMLCLRSEGQLELVAGKNSVPLAELMRYEAGSFSVDNSGVRQLVDASTTADSRYTPSNARQQASKLDTQDKYARWQKEYRALKKRRPELSDVGCAQQIATTKIAEGRSADTIRKHMKP